TRSRSLPVQPYCGEQVIEFAAGSHSGLEVGLGSFTSFPLSRRVRFALQERTFGQCPRKGTRYRTMVAEGVGNHPATITPATIANRAVSDAELQRDSDRDYFEKTITL